MQDVKLFNLVFYLYSHKDNDIYAIHRINHRYFRPIRRSTSANY